LADVNTKGRDDAARLAHGASSSKWGISSVSSLPSNGPRSFSC
jgi:hypothetical protein